MLENAKLVAAIKHVIPKRLVIPILGYVSVRQNKLQVTDLELSLEIPYESEIDFQIEAEDFFLLKEGGVLTLEDAKLVSTHGTRQMKFSTLIEDFPKVQVYEPKNEEKDGTKIIVELMQFKLTVEHVGKMYKMMKFATKDELRPVLMNVCIQGDLIVCTNTHVLAYEDFETPIIGECRFTQKAIKLMQLLGGEWVVDYRSTVSEGLVILRGDKGETITYFVDSGKYPQIKLVLPTDLPIVLRASRDELLDIIKTGSKFSESRVTLKYANEKVKLFFEDIELGKEFAADLTNFKYQDLDMREEFSIAVNYKSFVEKILYYNDTKMIDIEMSQRSRAVIINNCTLIMPLN